ncbi:MAG: hypothetical protein JKX70_04540, partial [Phycisphaerales bacterium]|nr:hypothetical protein [Phycisphaerales bacterium]
MNDGSFNYQGFLEFEGVPANGEFHFEVHLLDSNGDEIDSVFDQPGPITITDGLFDMDIQMGGTQADAELFWKRYGHLVKKMRIMVGTVQGGPYTTLSPDVDIGSSPHALWSRYAGALQFPYTDSHSNLFADPETMISLSNEFGGTVLDLTVGVETNEPTLRVAGQTLYDNSNFGIYSGELLVNSLDQFAGVVAITQGFPIIGELVTDNGSNSAAVIGEVNISSDPISIAVWALNQASGNNAALGTGSYAGDFSGDILARTDLRVLGEPTRDYSSSSPSPIGPLAYASISAA